jgi:F-type H+-transporting ATPase subunit delta
MALHPVARRYAQALIEVAQESGAVEQVSNDLHRFAHLLDAHGGMLGDALRSPVFTTEEREAVLNDLLPRLGLHPLTRNVLRLANDKHRFAVIADIAHAFEALADEAAGRQAATVITAEPMSPQVEAEVRAALERSTGKTIRLTTKVDPSLLGGMVAKIGGVVYDASIKSRLERLKQNLFQQEAGIA